MCHASRSMVVLTAFVKVYKYYNERRLTYSAKESMRTAAP